jgi:CRP/FNR family cyclic AMP-dependent transcriptional regulator
MLSNSTGPIDNEVFKALARHGETRQWEAATVVVAEGEPADALYVVHEGELRVFVTGGNQRAVELNTLQPGDIFGELMLSGERRAATVQTLTRTRLTCVTRAQVERLLKEQPELALHLIQRLVDRVRTLTQTVRNLGSLDVYQRLAGLLTAVAQEEAGRHCVRGMSQQRMAERVGASRAMINRLLQDLAAGGYIEAERGCIVLLRPLPARW